MCVGTYLWVDSPQLFVFLSYAVEQVWLPLVVRVDYDLVQVVAGLFELIEVLLVVPDLYLHHQRTNQSGLGGSGLQHPLLQHRPDLQEVHLHAQGVQRLDETGGHKKVHLK